MPTCQVKYSGGTPGADSNTYVIFDTTVASPNARGFLQLAGIKRVVVDIAHDKALTLNAYWSADGGTNWQQMYTEAFGVPSAATTRTRDFLVEHYADFKVSFANGGTAQTASAFAVQCALSEQRPAAT